MLGLTLLGGCSDRSTLGPEQSALAKAKSRWASAGPQTGSYVLEQQVQCFCATGGTVFEVTITQGVVSGARDATTGVAAPAFLLPSFRSVEQLFGEIEDAMRKPPMLSSVTYDAATGYPTLLALNSHLRAVDGEVVYLTRRLPRP
jgi:hypothetical protein